MQRYDQQQLASTQPAGTTTVAASAASLPPASSQLADFSSTMNNPIFRGRAVLDWISRHPVSGSSSSAGGVGAASAAAAVGVSAAANASATPRISSSLSTARHSTGANSEGCCSSLPSSNLSHSLASTGFSTDSEALGQFVEEQVATDNFVITTETAPNTSHFQGKHIRAAAAAAAAARAAAARARAGGADAAAVAAAAEAAAAAAVAAAASAGVQPTISEEEAEDYEIEFSEDGQVVDLTATTEAAIQAALAKQQQPGDGQQQRRWEATERLPGDFVYEMLPGVDDATRWATLTQTTGSTQQHHLAGTTRALQGVGAAHAQRNGAYSSSNSTTSSIYGSSALASTLSGDDGGSIGRTQLTGTSGASAAAADSRSWLYRTGGFFAGLKASAFGFMGTVGSLPSSTGNVLFACCCWLDGQLSMRVCASCRQPDTCAAGAGVPSF